MLAAEADVSLAPHLLLDGADFARIRAVARAEPWAGKIVRDLAAFAADWPASTATWPT